MKPHKGECEACGRPCVPDRSQHCRKCAAAQATIDKLEEAAWRNQAWSVFTRIEHAALEV